MVIPFILPCSSIFLKQDEKLTKDVNKLLWLLLTMSHKTGCCLYRHDVFVRASLWSELQDMCDYSLGQIEFAVAVTQLLCHVSTLLTSACKQV